VIRGQGIKGEKESRGIREYTKRRREI